MISKFFSWLLGLFGFNKKPNLFLDKEEERIDNQIKQKEKELKQIEKDKENVKENDNLDNNIEYLNNN